MLAELLNTYILLLYVAGSTIEQASYAADSLASELNSIGNKEPYYTNSTQLPVFYTKDLFKALSHQDPLQTRYTGGTVFHIFLGERLNSIEATKQLVKKVAENFHMPYYSLTPTFSVCPTHGYLAGEFFNCPKCKEEEQQKIISEISELKELLEQHVK